MQSFTSALLLLVIFNGAEAHEMVLEALTGYDTNPHKITSSFDLDKGAYESFRFEMQHTPARTGIYYELEGETNFYQTDEGLTDESNAENLDASAVLGFKWRPKGKYGRARYKWELEYDLNDAIYIDRATGDVKRFYVDNSPIGERFDYTSTGANFSLDLPISEDAEMKLDLRYKIKEYEPYPDLELLGLDNLNYEQAELDIGFEKEIWPKFYLETIIAASLRQYEDRRAKSFGSAVIEDGEDIPLSNEEYRFFEAKNRLEWRFAKRWRWKIGLDAFQRQDGYDGYRDANYFKGFTRFTYRNKPYIRFELDAAYYYRKLINTSFDPDPAVVDDEQDRTREGVRVTAEFIKSLTNFKISNLDLIFGYRYESFENVNEIFTYDRTAAYAGVRWRPY